MSKKTLKREGTELRIRLQYVGSACNEVCRDHAESGRLYAGFQVI